MSDNDIIVSLDIGTSKVRVIIGEMNHGTINIIGVGSADSEGTRKGAIVDIDQTVKSIQNAINHAEQMVGIEISEVYVGISGNHIELQTSHGVVAVSNDDREITTEDIQRVSQAAKVIALPPEREIIDIVPQQYLVDGLEGIQDPRGMIGVRLEVEATIITGTKTTIHNLLKCVEKANLKVSGLLSMPLAAGFLTLSKDEKSLGTVLVDVGAGETTIAIFDHGIMEATSTLPIGGDYITNDISIGLRTQSELAEKIKLKYGCALVEQAAEDQVFHVSNIGTNSDKEFTQVDLANIIEPRVREIFQLIQDEVVRLGHKEVPGVYVLTGGSVSMPGMQEAAMDELGTNVRIAVPDYIGVRDPAYTSGVGIIKYVMKYANPNQSRANKKPGRTNTGSQDGWFERLKNWFKEFI